jgi:gliding motility-associated-like protein
MNKLSIGFIIFLLSLINFGLAQNCPPNLDFEEGNLNGWECFIGTTKVEAGANVLSLQPTTAIANRHEIVSKANNAVDKYGGFPVVCPFGGNYSIRLGNEQMQAQAESVKYTFTVPNNLDTFTVTYYYAIVLQDPSHPAAEQPRFLVTAYDTQSGDIINCSAFDYIATGGIPGFQTSQTPANNVLYKDWTPASLQFTGLQGRSVTLEFKTADCTRGGHFGYAYIDVASICSDILATAPYCKESNSIVLQAPYGFQSYTWYNENFTQILGKERTITISPAPTTQGIFKVHIEPYPGYGCRDTLQAIVKPFPTPPLPTIADTIVICRYKKPERLVATGNANNDIVWFWDAAPTGTTTAPVPLTDSIGLFDFYVSQRELFGCESGRKKVVVKVIPSPKMELTISDSCVFKNINFIATPLSNDITGWTWNINGQVFNNTSQVTKRYTTKTVLPITLIANNIYGCADTIITQFTVAHNTAKALQDTVAVMNEPVKLTATGEAGTTYVWSPSTGLNNAMIQSPIATMATEQVYTLHTVSKEGCINNSSIKVKRYKGPDLYIADAFTPNNDGKNDVLKVFAAGIKQFLFMEIFDRYGKIVFRTTDTNVGWNGFIAGRLAEAGTYVVYAKAIDIKNNIIEKKQTLLVVR